MPVIEKINNTLVKKIYSLRDMKWRKEYNVFKAEGTKCVLDTLHQFELKYLVATQKWIDNHYDKLRTIHRGNIYCATPHDMDRLSSFSNSSQVVAVYEMPTAQTYSPQDINDLVICLDGVQDPGNLGTIMRVADWFGVEHIVCSQDCADAFSPKVVQATMGAISRVSVHRCDLVCFLAKVDVPIYGMDLTGKDIYNAQKVTPSVIVMGNEGHGLSREVEQLVSDKLIIPSWPINRITSESLNVSMATAITVAEFRRSYGKS